MNNNQTAQQIKSDPKGNAVASLVLGIISVIPLITVIISFTLGLTGPAIFLGVSFIVLSIPIGIIGIISGMWGLGSTKKKLAIVGITLSLIGIGSSIYIYLIALKMGTA